MNLENKLRNIVKRYDDIAIKMQDHAFVASKDFIALSKEYSTLQNIREMAMCYFKILQDIEGNNLLISAQEDIEIQRMAEEENQELKTKLLEIEEEIKLELIPKDEADSKNAILEIRAGTGGQEAALFASTLLMMYKYYAMRRGWKIEVMSSSKTELEGYKEICISVSGKNVFSCLKFESGVHRVQRVPETESSGRVHTSAATVAVLPEAEEIDIAIDDSEIRIDVFRASGAGGQHVNTTDSAVRITHLPTGLVVSQQDEKSQHKNKARALKVLRSRLYELKRQERETRISSMRKGQVGSGDRSERIRTYNYPQSRITDHRIGYTTHHFDEILKEGDLDQLIDQLRVNERATKMENM